MRTAIIFSGQIRRIKEDAPSVLTNLIAPYEADVFVSVWVPDNLRVPDYHFPQPEDESIDRIISTYNPKMIEVEKPYDLPNVPPKLHNYDGELNIHNSPTRVWAMFYRVERGNELRKRYEQIHGFKYDCVIRFRFEIGIHQPCPVITPEPNTIHIPQGQDHCGGVCDAIAIGDSESMDVYAGVYRMLPEYRSKSMPTHPESAVRKHLELNGVTIKRFRLHTTLRGKPFNPAY